MKRDIQALVAAGMLASLAVFTVSCGPVSPSNRTHKQAVEVKHLQNGRWVYQDPNSDAWFYYYVTQADGSRSYYTGDTLPTVGSASVSEDGEAGTVEIGQAAEGQAPTEADVSSAEVATAEIEFSAEGAPASQAEIAQSEAEASSESSSSESASDSSSGGDSSSSSSDSGSSGGDSGGGGGGDGGGGGGD